MDIMIVEALKGSLIDCLPMLPFLFAAFLILEAVEHYSGTFMNKALSKVGNTGPMVGAMLGCIPQCGFSVVAANLFSGGVITMGTLIAVFIATSDEAILILMGHPGSMGVIVTLLLTKIVIAIAAGYGVDMINRRRGEVNHIHMEEMCGHCGCHDGHGKILVPALKHTIKIFCYLFIFTLVLDLAMQLIGAERLSALLLKDTLFQPFIAALVGLIPNCAASVILTELFLGGTISFASVISGLCSGAGIGLVVLFKMNHNKKMNLKIAGILYGISVAAGIFIQLLSNFL